MGSYNLFSKEKYDEFNKNLPGSIAPLDIPAACLRKYDVGGLWITSLYDLSGLTLILVGRGIPSFKSLVFSLKSLQNVAMFTPL